MSSNAPLTVRTDIIATESTGMRERKFLKAIVEYTMHEGRTERNE